MSHNFFAIIFTEKIVRIKEFLQALKTIDIKIEKKVTIVAGIWLFSQKNIKYEDEISTKLRKREVSLMFHNINNNASLNLMIYDKHLAEFFLRYCICSDFYKFVEKSDN